MSMSFWCNVWAFAERSEDLDPITNEELIHLASLSNKPEDEAWLIQARKERCGELEYRRPHVLKISAEGNYGHCFPSYLLSEKYPNVLFVIYERVECDDGCAAFIRWHGDKKAIYPYSYDQIEKSSFEDMKKIFEIFDTGEAGIIPITEDTEIYFEDIETRCSTDYLAGEYD